jgi:hypothetical protein
MMKENIGMCLIQEDEFRQLQAPLNTIVDIIIELTYSFNIAFIIAAIVSIGGFILNQYMLLYDFNRRILEMRVGKVLISLHNSVHLGFDPKEIRSIRNCFLYRCPCLLLSCGNGVHFNLPNAWLVTHILSFHLDRPMDLQEICANVFQFE